MYRKCILSELYCLLCEPGGTNPKPEAPITTPELSTGASGGDIGNTTGPVCRERETKETFKHKVQLRRGDLHQPINELMTSNN